MLTDPWKVLKGTKYFTSKKEILVIVYSVSKFKYHLVGQYFDILSDNQALSFLLKCKMSNKHMSRWIVAIQEYDFSIKYTKARENLIAYTVSHYPPVEQENYSDIKNEIQIFAIKYVLPDNL